MFGALGNPDIAGLVEFARVLGVHAAADLQQNGFFKLGCFDFHDVWRQWIWLILQKAITEDKRERSPTERHVTIWFRFWLACRFLTRTYNSFVPGYASRFV